MKEIIEINNVSARNPQILVAKHKSGVMIDIAKAENGLSCECTCVCCGAPLVAKQGPDKASHFAHESVSDCAGSLETLLHLAAKQIIKESGLVFVGKHNPVVDVLSSFSLIMDFEPDVATKNWLNAIINNGQHAVLYKYASKDTISKLKVVKPKCEQSTIQISNIELEKRADGSNLIPDVTATFDNNKIYIEVVVTHDCDDDKIAKLKELNVPVVEIRLTPLLRTSFSLSDVREAIINGNMKGRNSNKTAVEWLVSPNYINTANELAYDFVSEALSNFTKELKAESERKKAEFEKWKAELAAKEAKKSKLKIFSTIVIVTQEKYSVSLWMPENANDAAFNEVSNVLSQFKAKRNQKNWLVSNPKLKEQIVEALYARNQAYIDEITRESERKFAEAQLQQELYEKQKVKVAEEQRILREQRDAESLRLLDARRIERQQEQERLGEIAIKEQVQRRAEEAINAEKRLQRTRARKEAVELVIKKHRDIKNYKWRIKMMNDELQSCGFGPLEPKDIEFI